MFIKTSIIAGVLIAGAVLTRNAGAAEVNGIHVPDSMKKAEVCHVYADGFVLGFLGNTAGAPKADLVLTSGEAFVTKYHITRTSPLVAVYQNGVASGWEVATGLPSNKRRSARLRLMDDDDDSSATIRAQIVSSCERT